MSTTIAPIPRRLAALAAVAALALVGAACSDDDDGGIVAGGEGTTQPTGDTGSTGGGFEHPTTADELIVRVFSGGGFVPVEFHLATSPSYELLGDGTAVEAGAVTAIYPGPAMNPLGARHLDEADIQEVLQRADDAGLLDGPVDYGEPNVADAPSTTVTIVADGQEHEQTAMALGFGDDEQSNLTAEQRAARKALQGFIDALATIGGTESQPYVPTAIAVFTVGPANPDPQVPQDPQPWPLATPPALPQDAGDRPCLPITGPDATQLLVALAQANQATPWTVPGAAEPLALVFRALLPGDAPCGEHTGSSDTPAATTATDGVVAGRGPATTAVTTTGATPAT
jgi:hypothetical protein